METKAAKSSGIIKRVLSPAIQLWLRSQAEQIENLHLNIDAGDRQILSGSIPHINLRASKAIYQGLHLSEIHLEAEALQTNLPQVLRRKPLQLISPVQAQGKVRITAEELAQSLTPTSLLWQGLSEWYQQLLKAAGSKSSPIIPHWQTMTLNQGHFTLTGTWLHPDQSETPLAISSGLKMLSPHQLHFTPLTIQAPETLGFSHLHQFHIDLGNEVTLKEIEITSEYLYCVGSIAILP